MSLRYLKNVATLYIDSEKCVGCGICTEVCPHQLLAIEQEKAVILDLDACMECGACAVNCAFSAIQVNAGVGCANAIIRSIFTGGEPTCGCDDKSDGDKGSCCC